MLAEMPPGLEPVQQQDVVRSGLLAVERVLGPQPDASLPEFRVTTPAIPVGEEAPRAAIEPNESLLDMADAKPSPVTVHIYGSGALPGWETPQELAAIRGNNQGKLFKKDPNNIAY